MFGAIKNWWKNASWRKPLWRGVRDVRDDVIESIEPALEEAVEALLVIGEQAFRDVAFRAFATMQNENMTGSEKAIAVRKDLLRTFRYFRDEGKESLLDILQAAFFRKWERENI